MKILTCPINGPRNITEFVWGGEVKVMPDVAASGIYQVRLQPLQGDLENRDFAVNVVPSEGDLAVVSSAELTRQLVGAEFTLHDAADMALGSEQLAGFRMSDALLGLLVIALIGCWLSTLST